MFFALIFVLAFMGCSNVIKQEDCLQVESDFFPVCVEKRFDANGNVIYEKYNEINSKRIEFETAIKAYKENPVKINMRTGDDTKRDTELLEKRKHELKAKNNSIEKGLQFDL